VCNVLLAFFTIYTLLQYKSAKFGKDGSQERLPSAWQNMANFTRFCIIAWINAAFLSAVEVSSVTVALEEF
jgi:hypothetical protein